MRLFIFISVLLLPNISFALTFQATSTAPKPIALKKAAVLRLGSGTAVTVRYKKKHYIITNHHIYGSKHCALEGCYAKVKYINETISRQKNIFLRPQALSKDADIVVFHVEKPLFKSFLKLSVKKIVPDSAVHILGYPRTSHLKWSAGRFVNYENKNMLIHAPTLPGSSGSAILNPAGQLIGIHHSSLKQHNHRFKKSLDSWSYSTNASQIKKLIDDGSGIKQFHSILKPTSFENAMENDQLYRNAAKYPVLHNKEDYFEKLLSTCEKGDFQTHDIDIFNNSSQVCRVATQWLSCSKSQRFISHCPLEKSKKRWKSVLSKIISHSESFHGVTISPWLSAISNLEPTKNHGKNQVYQVLAHHLKRTRPPLTPSIAHLIINWLPSGHLPVYQKQNLVPYITHYQKIPQYSFYALKIAQSASQLKRLRLIKGSIYNQIILSLKADPTITTSVKLKMERFMHSTKVS